MSIRKILIESPEQYPWLEDWLRSKGHEYKVKTLKAGKGSVAVVYDIKDENKVIRIETSSSEEQLREWQSVIGKDFDHVVDVEMATLAKNNTLIVVMEKLDKLDIKLDMEEFDILVALGDVADGVFTGKEELDRLLVEMVTNIEEYGTWLGDEFQEDPQRIYFKIENNKKFEELLLDVVEGMKELYSVGIDFYDLHDKNIMLDGRTGNYKIIDIA